MSTDALPLSGIVVLDLTRARAGPTAARVLADWGADVIHVEPPDRPGQKGGPLTGSRDGFDFQNLHRNKRSLTIDLATSEGHALFMRLAEKSDVVVENFRADVKHRLGIDYEAIAKINPRIVYGSIAGFGQDGPYRARALVSTRSRKGWRGSCRSPACQKAGRCGSEFRSPICAPAMFLAQGMMIALFEREKTGQGRWVHTSLTGGDGFHARFPGRALAAEGRGRGELPATITPPRCRSRATGRATSISTSRAANTLYERLCHAIGAPELIDHADFCTDDLRSKNRVALNAAIEAVIETKPAAYWIELLNEAGVPCGPVNRIDQVFADPQVEHLKMVRHVDHDRLGQLAVVRQPVNISGIEQPETLRYPAPDAGEHNEEVLKAFGLCDEEIDALVRSGVV